MFGFEGKVIVIIGVSSGIGEVIVKLFVEQGVKLMFGVCREECLVVLVDDIGFVGGSVVYCVMDVI